MGSIGCEGNVDGLKEELEQIWPDLLSEILQSPNFEEIPEARNWLEHVLSQTVPHGKQFRALLLVTFCDELMVPPEERNLSLIGGWGNEISHAAALIADDVIDGSETRRGQVCWYKRSGVGTCAVNDCLMLENIAYHILYKYFESKDYFGRLLKHTHEMAMLTIMGQSMDIRSSLHFNLDQCTWERYRKIVKYKTSLYTFYHPIAWAMIMARIHDDKLFSQIEEITSEIGYLFQVQDDFLDCFGNPKRTGKVGSDIRDGKCTWLLVTALDLVSDAQRAVLKVSYGQRTQIEETLVKNIYDDLRIEDRFFDFESETYRHISDQINKLPTSFPKTPLHHILKKIFRRRK